MSQEYSSIPDLSNVHYDQESFQMGVNAGTNFVKSKYAQLRDLAEEGEYSWRVMGFFAGMLMLLNGVLGALSSLFGLALFSLLINIYITMFGAICVLLEYQDRALTKQYLRIVEREIHFLLLPMGRGIFYTFCGTLLVVKGGLFSALSGICILCIGCVLFYSNREAAASLAELRATQFDDQKIQQLFNSYDKSGDGSLTPAELANLCNDLGSPLDYNTLESALLILDVNSDGKITYEEFVGWYKGSLA